MANNFKISGTYYISKNGNDANSGLTADLSKLTFNWYGSGKTVIGSGYYTRGSNITVGSGTGSFSFNMVFDGNSVLRLTNNVLIGNTGNSGRSMSVKTSNRFMPVYFDCNGFTLTFAGLPGNFTANSAVFKDGTLTHSSCNTNITACVYDSLTVNFSGATVSHSLYNSSFFNCAATFQTAAGQTRRLQECYVDSSTTIVWNDFVADFNAGRVTRNNIEGLINVSGTNYELKKDKAGVDIPSRIGNGIADLDSLLGSLGNLYLTNYAQSAEFVNLTNDDYWSVQETSPLLKSHSFFSLNVGNARQLNTLGLANDTDYFVTPGDEVILSGDNLIFDTGSLDDVGYITSEIIDLGAMTTLNHVSATMDLLFNTADGLGTAYNTDALATNLYTTAEAGATPARLTYEMRWSTSDDMPLLSSSWDNGGYITAGDFSVFEINRSCRLGWDSDNITELVGNGHPTYQRLDSFIIAARWVQFRLTIRRGLEIL